MSFVPPNGSDVSGLITRCAHSGGFAITFCLLWTMMACEGEPAQPSQTDHARDSGILPVDASTGMDAGAHTVPTAPETDGGAVADAGPTPDAHSGMDDAGPPADGGGQSDGGSMSARSCIPAPTPTLAIDSWEGPQGQATFSVENPGSCHQSFQLTTSATLREPQAATSRFIQEAVGTPTLRTGHPLFDSLHALALWELGLLSVDSISDAAFAGGQPISCGACFETGALWNYVWTRDASYAAELATAALDPERTKDTLSFKVSPRRDGSAPQIVQDTGTGGAYPVSTDRVAWALGADAVHTHLSPSQAADFRAQMYPAVKNTLEHDRRVVFDESLGLYRGESSFLDWREQTYPEWTAEDVVHIATSKSLSTNLLHLRALEIASAWAAFEEPNAASRYQQWAQSLRSAIQQQFWLSDVGQFAAYRMTDIEPAPVQRFDLLGSALAILSDVASVEQAQSMLSGYPLYGPGAPVIWPQQQHTPVYHNRGEWPFVTAYWLRAAAKIEHVALAEKLVQALVRGAALHLSHMENFEAATGDVYLDDGAASGPVVNSERQLWSVAGYLSMVHRTLLGLYGESDGLALRPFITTEMRTRFFPGTPYLALNDYPWRGKSLSLVIHFPAEEQGSGLYRVQSRLLNGRLVEGDKLLDGELESQNRVDVFLELALPPDAPTALPLKQVSDDDWRAIYGPKTPRIANVSRNGTSGALELELERIDEDAAFVEWLIYRDGNLVMNGLPGDANTFFDESWNPGSDPAPCYSAALRYRVSGNTSQPSPPFCHWGTSGSRVQTISAVNFEAIGGSFSQAHGRGHYESWGDEGHRLAVPAFVAQHSGPHAFQAVFGNGAGPISTGITCAVKHVSIQDVQSGAQVAEGYWVMPHLGSWSRWEDSNLVKASLVAGRTYRIEIAADPYAVNMSAFSHFATYGAAGGEMGAFHRVNVAAIKVLAR